MSQSSNYSRLIAYAATCAKGDRLDGIEILIEDKKTISTNRIRLELSKIRESLRKDAIFIRDITDSLSSESASPIDDIPFHNDTCTRCGSQLIPGKAIDNTLTGSGDFHDKDEAVTLSVGGTGNLIDCLKCSDDMCGRRFYETGTAFHSEVEA